MRDLLQLVLLDPHFRKGRIVSPMKELEEPQMELVSSLHRPPGSELIPVALKPLSPCTVDALKSARPCPMVDKVDILVLAIVGGEPHFAFTVDAT